TQAGIDVHAPSPGLTLPVTHTGDEVYDPVRGLLSLPTWFGTVERYDPATQTLLAPFRGPSALAGADVTPDGNYLYAAVADRGATGGLVRKFDLTTGAWTDLPYDLPDAAADVKIAADGLVLVTLAPPGVPGTEPLLQIDLRTGVVSRR